MAKGAKRTTGTKGKTIKVKLPQRRGNNNNQVGNKSNYYRNGRNGGYRNYVIDKMKLKNQLKTTNKVADTIKAVGGSVALNSTDKVASSTADIIEASKGNNNSQQTINQMLSAWNSQMNGNPTGTVSGDGTAGAGGTGSFMS